VTPEGHTTGPWSDTSERPQAERGLARAQPEGGSAGRAGKGGSQGFPRAVTRALNEPRAALVEEGFDGTPRRVNRQPVAVVREEWRVLDRWWTEEPVARRYFEVVLESGQNVVVFRDEERGGWFSQRGA
jgi:hypothetical protein